MTPTKMKTKAPNDAKHVSSARLSTLKGKWVVGNVKGGVQTAQLNFRIMFNLFQQKTATLFNGKKVKEGDKVYFINSDGIRCEGLIQRRKFDVKLASPHYGTPRSKEPHKETTLKKGSLFFWNAGFLIEDYVNLDVVA